MVMLRWWFLAFAELAGAAALVASEAMKAARQELLHHADACWFVSDLLMGLGMTGTVLGFS